VINFFASWCPACQSELAAFGTTASHFGHSVAFVGIDTNDSAPGLAATLARRAGVAYPLLRDIGSGTVATAFGINHLPTTFIVGADGRIRAELPGAATKAELERILAPLVKPPAH
jgi:cytochrome c biogenesis protein CcmG/thiol:disulfide interchange protein DsbE